MASNNLVFLAVAALLVFWAVGAYNRLVRLKNTIAQAFGQMDVQLKRRHDLIPSLVDALRKHLLLEQAALHAVVSARHQARSASDAARNRLGKADALGAWATAEQTLDSSLSRLFALADDCPGLGADLTIGELRQALASAESTVGFARQSYNEAVLDYNQAQSQFPALLIARVFGFAPVALLPVRPSPAKRPADR